MSLTNIIDTLWAIVIGLIPIAVIAEFNLILISRVDSFVRDTSYSVKTKNKLILVFVTLITFPFIAIIFKSSLSIDRFLNILPIPDTKNVFVSFYKFVLTAHVYLNDYVPKIGIFCKWYFVFLGIAMVFIYYKFYVKIMGIENEILDADIDDIKLAAKRNAEKPRVYEYTTTTRYSSFSNSLKSTTKSRDVTNYETPMSTSFVATFMITVLLVFFPITTLIVRMISTCKCLMKHPKK